MAYPIYEPRLLKSIEASAGDVNYCCYSPSGTTIATASANGLINLWNAKDGSELSQSPLKGGHSDKFYVNSCVFSPSGNVLVTVSSDHSIIVWDTNSFSKIGSCNGHSGSVKDCAFSPNGRLLLTVSADKTAKLWEGHSLRNLATFQRGDSVLSSCCFSFDGLYAITGDNSGYVSVWDANKGVYLCQVNADDLGVNCVASAPQTLGQEDKNVKSLVVACCNNSEVKGYVLDYVKGKYSLVKKAVLKEHSGAVYHCRFTEHFTHFATCGADKKVILWSTETWGVVWKVQAHNRFVTCCSFSPDMCVLATTSNDKMLKLWDISGGRVSKALYDSNEKVAMDTENTSNSVPVASIEAVCTWLNNLAVAKQPVTLAARDAVIKLSKCIENSNVL